MQHQPTPPPQKTRQAPLGHILLHNHTLKLHLVAVPKLWHDSGFTQKGLSGVVLYALKRGIVPSVNAQHQISGFPPPSGLQQFQVQCSAATVCCAATVPSMIFSWMRLVQSLSV